METRANTNTETISYAPEVDSINGKTSSKTKVGEKKEANLRKVFNSHKEETDRKIDLIHKLIVGALWGVIATFLTFLMTACSFLWDVIKDSEKYFVIQKEYLEVNESVQNLKNEFSSFKEENNNILDGYSEESTVKENMESILKQIADLKKLSETK